jgi:hypothetical protein
VHEVEINPAGAGGHRLAVDLTRTVAATWRCSVAGTRGDLKAHWRTREAYYAAVSNLMAADPVAAPTWRATVAAVRPAGSRTTFYEVAGRNARHRLMAAYHAASTADSLQIALLYRRTSATESLLDEAKVWAFWPARRAWLEVLAHLTTGATTASAAYLKVIAEWALHNPALAGAMDFAPPACAVEDLAMIHRGDLPALRAYTLLRTTILESTTDCVPG